MEKALSHFVSLAFSLYSPTVHSINGLPNNGTRNMTAPLPERKQYTYGIVLGGYSYWDWKRSRPEFSEIADRLLEGIRLYKHGRIRKLVLASDGSIIESKDRKGLQGNAADMKQYLADLGMPLEDVILETRANNTWKTQRSR